MVRCLQVKLSVQLILFSFFHDFDWLRHKNWQVLLQHIICYDQVCFHCHYGTV
jgi:hypothetical protein